MAQRRSTEAPSPLCHAPSVELHLSPDGAVRPCCLFADPLGVIGERTLSDIWHGQRIDAVRADLAHGTFPTGCAGCESEITIEGRSGSYPDLFELRRRRTPIDGDWPTWIEFNLSNRCNLQCIQCDGELSSSIRSQREGRPPLISPYDDAFFDDLERFIPHLEHAQFAGGEPFLADANYRVWDLIETLNPELECITITNATRWTPRIAAVLERLNMGITLSLDGITPVTFEAIRVGATFDRVMENVDRFLETTRRRGQPLTINHCLMPQNAAEFMLLLQWASARDIDVNVSVVRGPAHCSLTRLDRAALVDLHDLMRRQHDENTADLGRNEAVWQREFNRIGSWIDADAQDLDLAWAKSRYHSTVLDFPGWGPVDPTGVERARAELASVSVDGTVHELRVDHNVISEVSPSLHDLLGAQAAELVGTNVDTLNVTLGSAWGPLVSYDVVSSTPVRRDAVARTAEVEMRLAMVPVRDGDGVTQYGVMLLTEAARVDAAADAS